MNDLNKYSNRLRRGVLKSFDELPQHVQNNFKLIKEELLKLTTGEIKIYIYGSFHWGFWFEGSDYDVVITKIINKEHFKSFMMETHNIKIDIFTFIPENELVEIP